MQARFVTFLAVVALLALPAAAQQVSGTVALGGQQTSDSKNPNRAGEYRSTKSGATETIDLTAPLDGFFLALRSTATSREDQRHNLSFDIARTVRSHVTFTRLPHNLEHDTLANLKGTVKDVVYTGSTDLNPLDRYGIQYDRLESRTDFQLPALGWLVVSAHYDEQWRRGHTQSLALSHCSSCHVQSQSREIDEHVQKAGVSARATFGAWSVSGGTWTRNFRERGTTPIRYYELVEQPAQRKPLFDDRMQWSNVVLPYDSVSPTEKKTSKLEVASSNLGGFSLAIRGVKSQVTNDRTNAEVDYDSVGFTLARTIGGSARFTLTGRHYAIDSTDVFVDTVEPKAVAGVYPGKTYRERNGYNPDFLRRSAIDRTVNEAQARFGLRLGHAGTLTATLDGRSIDRDNYLVAPGDSKTTEVVAKLAYVVRPAKGVQLRADATYADIDNPFMILNAACNPTVMQSTSLPSPMAPGSVQYYQIHDARVADLAASPSQWSQVRLAGSYQFGPAALASLSYRWWDGKNSDLDLTDWSKTINAVTGTVTFSPSETSDIFVAATWSKRELETHICIPLMDG